MRGLAHAAIVGTLLAPEAAFAQEVADTIYSGGAILTMNDAAPTAETVAVKDGKILAVGTVAEIEAFRGTETKAFDLSGRSMLPGFFDAHGHMLIGGLQALSANLLSPPDGEVGDMAGLKETLKAWAKDNANAVRQANLIVGIGYDPAQLAEERHPTREDLDAVSADVPVFVIHQSGHMGAGNSKALEVAGITADSQDPAGGKILRGADGQPTGVLEENAFYAALTKLIAPVGAEGFETFARARAELWAKYGYTTAEEGRSVPATEDMLRKVADEGGFKIDVLTYPDVLVDRDYIAAHISRDYKNRFRVAGAKLTIDGSPQGFTALRDRPYYDPVGDYPPGYAGYAAATMEQIVDAIDWAFANGIQINTHANGEGASDMLIAGIDAPTKKYGPADRRPALIHGQFLREDQVNSYKRLDVFMSLFPMHTFYWGDWHREHTVGPELVDNIAPTGWVVKRGMKFSTHHDAPVSFPNSMRVLDATVTRRSRSGDIIGPAQRVDVMTALKAMTIWPAYQHFEEAPKGSIEPGKLADFAILSKNPTAVDPETLDTIDVVATIKEDVVVFEAQ
ncbi:amidohydrolase [Ancylobacter mangrovi]|uniref:amidohydrolase n=1 Tax=Ancylobacter mangrovi TaxID=2972472 RepID=UPI0021625CCA|nr:amidohydrolase [Ancylobacter mangrovi]MCS0501936.1 amidohydrolase [Ancylobacter mangrovi]